MNWSEGPLTPKKKRGELLAGEPVSKLEIDQVVRSLETVPEVRAGLERAVAGVKVMAHSGLTLHGLALLVHDQCEWSEARKPIPLSTVEKVIKAMLNLDAHLVKR